MFFSLSAVAMLAVTAASLPSVPRNHTGPAPYMVFNSSSFTPHHKGGLQRYGDSSTTLGKRWTCNTAVTLTSGDTDDGGVGITITNADTVSRGYFVYHNGCDTVPYKYIWIDAGDTEYISLPSAFQGRVTRGTNQYNLNGTAQWLATWLEIGLDSDGVGWADVSLIRGCDGAITIQSLDGTDATTGFSQWILDGAPTGAYATKSDGQKVLGPTENLDGSINAIPLAWYIAEVGATNAYVDDYSGNPVISSSNGRFATTWEVGRP